MSRSSAFVRTVRGLRIALFGLPHRHRWETVRECAVGDGKGAWIHTDYELRCRCCDEITKRRV